jgi:hypothetical protein
METAIFNRPIAEGVESDLLSYLRSSLDEVCGKIAEKYGVYSVTGRARKTYVFDVLTRYTCPGCVVKSLTQMSVRPEVDAIFRENHDLAVSLLVQALRNLSSGGLAVNGEVDCGLGRLDVLVKRLNGGLLQVQASGHELIVEIKTNMGFGMKQALRYLVERPDATAIIWRVRKRQILVIDGRKHRWLLIAYIAAALQQGLTILNEDFTTCDHDFTDKPFEVNDPQGFLDDFLTSLIDGLPKVVDAVMQLLGCKNEDELGGV